MTTKRILLLAGICIGICIGIYMWMDSRSNVYTAKSKSVVDIAPKSAVTEPWPFTREKETQKFILDKEGNSTPLPYIYAHVTNKRNGKVTDYFKFDATKSYNPISDKTVHAWYIDNGEGRLRVVSTSKRFDLKLDKKKNYIVEFRMYDESNEEHLTGASVRFEIPLYDVYYKPSPLDTGKKYDE